MYILLCILQNEEKKRKQEAKQTTRQCSPPTSMQIMQSGRSEADAVRVALTIKKMQIDPIMTMTPNTHLCTVELSKSQKSYVICSIWSAALHCMPTLLHGK